jgi:hypothetical protein
MGSRPETVNLGKNNCYLFYREFFGWLKVLFGGRIWVINRLSTAARASDCPVCRSFLGCNSVQQRDLGFL